VREPCHHHVATAELHVPFPKRSSIATDSSRSRSVSTAVQGLSSYSPPEGVYTRPGAAVHILARYRERVPGGPPGSICADEPLPDLGNAAEGSFNAAFCDATVQTIKRSAGEDLIRAAITRAGGEVMDTNQLFEPRAERANVQVDRAGALAENRRLHEQLQEARNALDRLKTEVEATQGRAAPDKETLRLMEENARLREQIQRLRQETQELAEQLHQSKPLHGGPDR